MGHAGTGLPGGTASKLALALLGVTPQYTDWLTKTAGKNHFFRLTPLSPGVDRNSMRKSHMTDRERSLTGHVTRVLGVELGPSARAAAHALSRKAVSLAHIQLLIWVLEPERRLSGLHGQSFDQLSRLPGPFAKYFLFFGLT